MATKPEIDAIVWHHAPPPFNPDFIPGAREAWRDAVAMATEQEIGSCATWGREHRAKVRRVLYERLIKERGLKSIIELREASKHDC